MFSWWKKMPLWVIITGWHHQKCFSFSFGLISKKQERDNEVFVIKTKNQKKSLIIWNSDIQTFKYSFAFKSSQGSLLTINTGHQGPRRGVGPTKAHFCLVEYLVWFWLRWSLGHTSRNTPVFGAYFKKQTIKIVCFFQKLICVGSCYLPVHG